MAGDYDFVRFSMADINGLHRTKTITKHALGDALKNGINASIGLGIWGYRGQRFEFDSEMYRHGNGVLVPDLTTLHPLPFATGGKHKVGQVYGELYHNGKPQPAMPRYVARCQLQALHDLGFDIKSAFEMEYLITKNGKLLVEACDAFTSLSINPHEELLYDISKELDKMDVHVEAIHTEPDRGLFEMTMIPSFGIAAIDKAFLMKDAIKQICQLKGYEASFMTMNSHDALGAMANFNHSLWDLDQTTNLMYDPDKPDHLSDDMKHWVAGLLKHAKAITALCCPTVNCYRIMGNKMRQDKVTWAIDSRWALVRVKSLSSSATYAENRLPTPPSNPYIVLAATIAAGIDGITNKLELPKELCEDAELLPRNLEDALKELEKDQVIKDALGDVFIEWFVMLKRITDLTVLKESDVTKRKEEYDRISGKVNDFGLKNEQELYMKFA